MDSLDWLQACAAAAPERAALVMPTETVSYADLRTRALSAAAALYSEGVRPSDVVALTLEPGPAWVAALHGALFVGAVTMPVATRFTAAERRDVLEHSGAAAVVSEELVTDPARAPLPAVQDADAVATVVLTSGTETRPKGVELTYANHRASALAVGEVLGAGPEDVWLCCLPLEHVGGLEILFRALLCAAPVGVPVVLHSGFDAAAVAADIERHRVTLVSLVPTMLRRLLEEAEGADLSSLRCVLVGGGPVPGPLLEEAAARGLPVSQTYGLTEACSAVTLQRPGEAAERPGSAGPPLPGTEVRISDGEILVRGPTVMRSYRGSFEATRRALAGGWLHSGDEGVLEDGELRVTGRSTETIVTGGENVSPAEVEAVLAAHPAVADAAVAGRPSQEWGEEVVAFVVLREGAALDEGALRAHAAERLAPQKVPREFVVVAELPRSATGKLERRRLAAS